MISSLFSLSLCQGTGSRNAVLGKTIPVVFLILITVQKSLQKMIYFLALRIPTAEVLAASADGGT